MRFVKMEGAGNDYVYCDTFTQFVNKDPEYIKKLSDRHFGIGSDGLILLEKSRHYDFKMTMYNSDGSLGNMCGNGLRCLAKYAYDYGFTDKQVIDFETSAGYRQVKLLFENNEVVGGTCLMGKPEINVSKIPMNFHSNQCINQKIEVNGKSFIGTAISMGNPHFVIINQEYDFDIDGPLLESSSYFPEKANIEFIKIINRQTIEMRVYERGSGETLACGTGACASMYACYLNGLVDETVNILVKGGKLTVSYLDGNLYLTGKAKQVFKGEYEDE